jgi:hypothetical protein
VFESPFFKKDQNTRSKGFLQNPVFATKGCVKNDGPHVAHEDLCDAQ